ncbi:hypothetical protein LshimejAT787_1301430 [Lyophyllum shimeji]|uniref:Uncharacterized protein n=1 Tax=Lyophyllum shimeji TaxID=47721 RepID=A0A9P3USI0_LYOSH|nr:hypothetical protein LshimejAT787_1301430 [Lyophyllum shimeji]
MAENADGVDYRAVPTSPYPASDAPERARKSIIITVVLPALFAFLLTAGLGIFLLAWLVTHQVDFEHRNRTLLVDEGTKNDDPTEASLRGLTIASVTSTLVSLVNPLVMALLAYLIALRWLSMSSDEANDAKGSPGESSSLPTPLQYGLMVRLLSGGTPTALYDSARYLFKGSSQKSDISILFKLSLFVAIVSYVLTNAVGAADLWLHLATSATVLNTTTPLQSPLSYSVAFNDSICNDWVASPICLVRLDGWAGSEQWIMSAGLEIASNSSKSLMLTTLSQANDATILIPRDVDFSVEFRAKTYGARAKCRSLNPICTRSFDTVRNCSNVGVPELPFNTTDFEVLNQKTTSVILGRVEDVLVGENYGVYRAWDKVPTNPFPTFLQFEWTSFINQGIEAPSPAIDVHEVPRIKMYADCNTSFFEAVVKRPMAPGEDGKRYIIEDERPIDGNMTAILMAPLFYQYVTAKFASNVHSTILAETNLANVEAALSQELSRMALGVVGGVFQTAPTLSQSHIGTKVVGRYPFAPVFTFVTILCVYAFLVLVVVLWSFVRFGASSDHVAYNVAPARLWLTNPMAIVASLFPTSRSQIHTDDPVALFDERDPSKEPQRLCLSGGGVDEARDSASSLLRRR